MLNVNSYNVKYRVFVCVAHKLIPFHKTRRSQSPPGGPIPCWHIVAWFGTTAYPLSLSYDRCLALPCLAMPCHATQCLAVPRSVWMLPHPSRQRHALAVGYENCCLEFCCGLVSEPMLPPSRLSAPLLGPPSPRGLSSHHQSNGPLSSFPGGLLLRPPYRYGLHAAQTGFLRPGFRLLSGWCAGRVRLPRAS